MFYCKDCKSLYIAVEAIVVQTGNSDKLEIVETCDKGHVCNNCGSENIGWLIRSAHPGHELVDDVTGEPWKRTKP